MPERDVDTVLSVVTTAKRLAANCIATAAIHHARCRTLAAPAKYFNYVSFVDARFSVYVARF